MIIVLDSTSKSIRAVLGEAHTTNPVDFTITYAESTLTTRAEKTDPSQSNGTTNMEVLGAPASGAERAIAAMTIWNHDTVDHLVTVYLRVTATDYGLYSETIEAGGFRFLDDLQSTGAAGGGDMVLADIQTVTGAKTFNSGKFILAGSSSGTTTVNATAAASGTLTLPAATDTLVGKDTTDTLTNKTLTSPVLNTPTVGTSIKPVTTNGADIGGTSKLFANLYLSETGKVVFGSLATNYIEAISTGGYNIVGSILPTTDALYDLGNAAKQYGSLYLASSIYFDGDVTLAQSSNMLTITGGDLTAPNVIVTTALLPDANDGAAIGTTALQFSDLFLAEGAVINFDNGDITVTQSGNDLTIAGGSLTARVKPRTGGTTSSATPTINTDNVDLYELTAQTVDITSFTTNLSGTPTKKQNLWIAITGTAARAITWGSSFESSTVTLPTTTVSTNRLDVGFVWNDATSKWRCVAKA